MIEAEQSAARHRTHTGFLGELKKNAIVALRPELDRTPGP
jgi:hypothetical protein